MSAEAKTRHRTATDDGRLECDVGIVGLLFAAVGSIIGSGWLFGALSASQIAGPASILAWGIGGIMVMLIGLCYAEFGTMFPVSGGVVRFPHFAFGSFASYTLGWITWLAVASTTSIEVLAALQYSTNYVPWLQHLQDGVPVLTPAGFAVAVAMLGLFSLVNVIGIRWFARLNNALVWWKLFIIIVVVIVAFLLASLHGVNFNHEVTGGFMPFGWSGVLSSIATAGIVFSYLGFRQGVELAGENSNPQRNACRRRDLPAAVPGLAEAGRFRDLGYGAVVWFRAARAGGDAQAAAKSRAAIPVALRPCHRVPGLPVFQPDRVLVGLGHRLETDGRSGDRLRDPGDRGVLGSDHVAGDVNAVAYRDGREALAR